MNKEEFIAKLQMVYVGDRNAFNELVNVYDNLLQRIDKAIEILNKYKKFCASKLNFEKDIYSPTARYNETHWKYCIDKLDYILKILQDKEVK